MQPAKITSVNLRVFSLSPRKTCHQNVGFSLTHASWSGI
jgi:hypothetical protein